MISACCMIDVQRGNGSWSLLARDSARRCVALPPHPHNPYRSSLAAQGDEFCPTSAEHLAERGLLPGGGVRRRGGGGGAAPGGRRAAINRRKQGGDDYLAQVGALAVPEHARARRGRAAGGAQGTLVQARSVLTLTAVPRSLPCREEERRQIAGFVGEVLKEGESALVVWVAELHKFFAWLGTVL